MSGIVGIYYLDGRPVEHDTLGRMVDILAHRGPDGADAWSQGPVGLGHRMLWTTPESLLELLPLVDQTGELVITADARIDNRDELIAALSLCDRPAEKITDSQLILGAYVKWGEQCPERLLGDFAFAIWDGRQQKLFCARDHFGIRLFYYYRSNRIFAFGSEIKVLLRLPEVPRYLNEMRVADYLADLFHDGSITFYQDIFRLPPAHVMTVRKGAIKIRPYWSLDPSRELRLSSDEEYATAFRELFTEAVRCRLRSAYPVGSTLSGGLDSSSVTCVARELSAKAAGSQLHTLSLIFESFPQCDERPFINSVVAQGGLIPHYITADRFGPFLDWQRAYWHIDETLLFPNTFLPWVISRAAKQEGIRILLDGLDGDNTVSHGFAYMAELACRGQWATFFANATSLSQHYSQYPEHETSLTSLFTHYGLPYLRKHLEELARKRQWGNFIREILAIKKHFTISGRNLVLQHGLKPLAPQVLRQAWQMMRARNGSKEDMNPIFNYEFVSHIGLKKRIQSFNSFGASPPLSAREQQWRNLTSGVLGQVLEVVNRIAPAFTLELRHPFMDKRLVEFCLALPPEQKLHQGWSRMILRRAMAGVLPEQVQWRGGKSNLSPVISNGMLTINREILDDVMDNGLVSVERYIDTTTIRQFYKQIIFSRNNRDSMFLSVWKSVDLALWLRYTGLLPQ